MKPYFWIDCLFATLVLILLSLCSISVKAQKIKDGKATYYSNKLLGRRMSNGEFYHPDSMTCAHRTLPFGTRILVTNPRNGRQVVVRVADRGPFVRGRVIDLSYAAARELGFLTAGVAYMKLEIAPDDPSIPYYNIEEDNPLQLQPVEYGMVGVGYEFIPQWRKQDDQPRYVPRKVKPNLTPHRTKKAQKPNKAAAKSAKMAVKTVQTAPNQPASDSRRGMQKGENKWTKFFRDLFSEGNSK